MRLPGNTQGGTQQLAKQNVMSPIAEANARRAAYGAANITIDTAMERYTVRETNRQLQDASMSVMARQQEFEKYYGSRLEYDLGDDDVQNDPELKQLLLDAGATAPGQKIPAHRVNPELRRRISTQSIEEYSKGIEDEDTRTKFSNQNTQASEQTYLKDTVSASKNQIKYNILNTQRLKTDALKKDNFQGARYAITMSELSADQKTAEFDTITTAEQNYYFNNVLKQDDEREMKKALVKLLDDKDPSTSHLSERQEKGFASQLKNAIDNKKSAREGKAAAGKAMILDDSRKATNAMFEGQTVDPIEVNRLEAQLSAMGKEKELRNLRSAAQAQSKMSMISKLPISEQLTYLSDPTQPYSTQDAYTRSKMDDVVNRNIREMNSDMMSYAVKHSIEDITPIDFGSPQALRDTLRLRTGSYAALRDRFKTTTGYLAKNEMLRFDDMIKRTQDPKEQLKLAATIKSAFGGDEQGNQRFYEQLKNSNIGGTFSYAAQMATEGNVDGALKVLRGNQVRTEDPRFLGKAGKDAVNAAVTASFGNMFAGNSTQRGLALQATLDAYAQEVAEKGLDPEQYNAEVAQRAVQTAVGSVMVYNGSTLQSPEPNMSSGEFGRWVDSLDTSVFDGTNSLQSPQEIKDLVTRGTWKLRGVGKGTYFIIDINGGKLMRDNGSTPYTLNFDRNLPRVYIKPSDADLARLRSGAEFMYGEDL